MTTKYSIRMRLLTRRRKTMKTTSLHSKYDAKKRHKNKHWEIQNIRGRKDDLHARHCKWVKLDSAEKLYNCQIIRLLYQRQTETSRYSLILWTWHDYYLHHLTAINYRVDNIIFEGINISWSNSQDKVHQRCKFNQWIHTPVLLWPQGLAAQAAVVQQQWSSSSTTVYPLQQINL